MRRALQRANTFHTCVETPGSPPAGGSTTTPPAIPHHASSSPDNQSVLAVRKDRHASNRHPKRSERSHTKSPTIPHTASVPDYPHRTPEHDPNSPLAVANSKNGISQTQINLNDIFTRINGSWSKPFHETPLSVDFPRLASRVVVQDVRGGKSEEYCPQENEQPKELITNIMNRLCEIVENEQSVSEKLRNYLEKVKNNHGELRRWTDDLLEEAGATSKTVAICKTIHQNIIGPVATQIKVIIFSLTDGFTKDVRTPDGWRIIIRFSDDYVTCTHIKREVSMATGDNAFEFEWHLTIRLSSGVDKIEKVELLLTGLTCSEGMQMEKKQRLTDAMTQMVVG